MHQVPPALRLGTARLRCAPRPAPPGGGGAGRVRSCHRGPWPV